MLISKDTLYVLKLEIKKNNKNAAEKGFLS
jgi:hypothetical protein